MYARHNKEGLEMEYVDEKYYNYSWYSKESEKIELQKASMHVHTYVSI